MAVAFDAKMTGGNSVDGMCQQDNGVTSLSSTGMTVGASATALVAIAVWETGGDTTDPTSRTVTWNGVVMTEASFITSSATEKVATAIYVLANPATGNRTLAASWTNTKDAYMSCVSFTGTDVATVINAADTTTAIQTTSITVPSGTDGATVATFIVNGGVPTMNQTAIYGNAPFAPGAGASYAIGGTSNAHTFTGAGGTLQALAGVHVIVPRPSATAIAYYNLFPRPKFRKPLTSGRLL